MGACTLVPTFYVEMPPERSAFTWLNPQGFPRRPWEPGNYIPI
jgi:hypothetical protein